MIKKYPITIGFKIALRKLWKHKVFSVINIMGLAVGMTACFLIYLYVHFETSYDSFNTKADRIYRVVSDIKTPSESLQWSSTSAPVAINMQRDFPEVESMVRISGQSFLVRKGNDKFQENNTIMADSTLFKIFDFPLIYGDKNTALKEPMSIVLSETAVKKYFGTVNPIGKSVLLTGGGINATITGVMKDIPENSQVKA
ncbi:MAG: ABC transporter permease, partial [Ginsengibacter sp.]